MSTDDLRIATASPSQWGRVLSIEFPRARFEAVRSNVVRDLRRGLARPGFRRGHVPAAIVERDFAERIESNTLEKLLPSICDQAIQREALDIISTPRVQNLVLDHPEVVRFDLEVEVRPRLQLGPLESLQAQRWVQPLTEAHVDRALEELREGHAQFLDVDREAGDGDFVQVSYVPVDERGAERRGQRVENYPFEVGAGQVVEEFESAVRGRKAGDTAEARVHYPSDAEDRKLAGKNVAFVLTLRTVKEKRLPVLDDDFARDLGLESLAELRQRVGADLERRLRDESERDLRESLVDALIAANPFEAPRSMVEQYLELAAGEFAARFRRLDRQPTEEQRRQFLASARPAAERAARRLVLLETLADAHGLLASEEDVDTWIEDKVQAGGPTAQEVRAFFADAQRRRRLRNELTEARVFGFLESRAAITEVPRPMAPAES